jgi:hypothetical protein
MPFTPTTYTVGGPVTAANLNNGETQYAEASLSFERDLFAAFVYSGLVATKNGVTVNQLDVTTGIAFLLQSADNTLRRQAPAASTAGQFLTATPSTTYYLFLNADGTWTWGTASVPPAYSLLICQATTDGSGNILVVTDVRPTTAMMLPGMAGALQVTGPIKLAAGHQETGACGVNFHGTIAGDTFAYLVNFKTHMTNIPSGITLTVTASGNATVAAQLRTVDGFLFVITATVAGTASWYGTYTTVGN